MHQIIIDGMEATISPTEATTLERYNPLLDFDSVRGSKVLDFTLPHSAINNNIFGHYANNAVGYKFRDYLCEKRINGRMLERGYIQLKNVDANGFQVFYTQNLGELFGDFQETKLNEMEMGSEVIPDPFVADPDVATAKFALPKIDNAAFYGNDAAGYSGYVNDFNAGAYLAGPKTPMFFMRWVFEKITEITGVSFSGAFFDDASMERLILYNTFSLDGATDIYYKNHLPDLTIPELLKELRKLFNLAIWVNVWDKSVRIDFADTYFNREVTVDWSKKFPVINNKAPELNNRLDLDWGLDKNDALMKEIPTAMAGYTSSQIHDQEGLFSVNSAFSTLMMEGSVPKTEQVGISVTNKQKTNSFSPRLLFWHGVSADVPVASSTSPAGVVLKWEGVGGLLETYWESYEAFRRRTYKVTLPANLNAYDLSRINMHQKAGELVSVHVQGSNYIIGNQRITLQKEGALPIIDLWRI